MYGFRSFLRRRRKGVRKVSEHLQTTQPRRHSVEMLPPTDVVTC